jgi:hypothetical protein
MQVEDALLLAVEAHAGQRDKAGMPLVLHPLRVALALADQGESAMVVGALHDVLEDGGAGWLPRLRERGLTDQQEQALVALTHGPHEPYAAYIRRVAVLPLARTVKLADLADNLDPGRLGKLAAEDQARLRRKYEAAVKELAGRAEPALGR